VFKRQSLIVILFLVFFLNLVYAEVPYSPTPDYISTELFFYSTGGAFGDIDKNGYLDLVFSNGNDMLSQGETVYYNYDGILENSYGWISEDDDFSGHLALGDLDNDGDLDLVVANFMDEISGQKFIETTSKIYMNHDGFFESKPTWESVLKNNSFSTALGDFDGDGDLDVAFAHGQVYGGDLQQNHIYKNNNGMIETIPCWFTTEAYHTMDLVFGDFNSDGNLDVAYANTNAPITIHYGDGITLSNSASWFSNDIDSLNSITTGDFNSDGYVDIAVTSNSSYLAYSKINSKFMGTGVTKIYYNNGSEIEKDPTWVSSDAGVTSSIAGGDIDGDGDTDLAVGGWWEGSRIYVNEEGTLGNSSVWSSGSLYRSVAEAMQFGDVDNDGLTAVYDEIKYIDNTSKVIYLNHAPVRGIIEIFVNGKRLDYIDFKLNPELGYITFSPGANIQKGEISVSYLYSKDLDLLVSNWDPDKGNYIFFNHSEDISPPYVMDHVPPRGTQNVMIDSDVRFKIIDSKSGVDIDSIKIVSNLDGEFETNKVDDGYLVKYNGEMDSNFEVLIEIEASDLAAKPNIMPTHYYRFMTAPKSSIQPPKILWGGFLDTNITNQSGGVLKISSQVKAGDEEVVEVRVYLEGIYTGLSIFDNGLDGDSIAGDEIFTSFIPIPKGVPMNTYLFEFVAVDSNGLESSIWPYLRVDEE